MNESKGTEHRLSLRQSDAARADLYAIHDELDFIKTQIGRLPTRKELAWVAVLSLLGGVALAAPPCARAGAGIGRHRARRGSMGRPPHIVRVAGRYRR
jgi:hypothetical protein